MTVCMRIRYDFEIISEAERQIRAGLRIYFKDSFYFPTKTCGPSLEPSRRDDSNGGIKICFDGEIRLTIPVIHSYLEPCKDFFKMYLNLQIIQILWHLKQNRHVA